MRALLFAGAVLSAAHLLAADTPDAGWKLVEVKKIWDKAPHNAFTDLIRFKDRWYCACREGTGHAAGAGVIRVLTSDAGGKWESAAAIEEQGIDLRDPKLSITPDGRLMIVGGAAVPPTRDPLKDHFSFVCFSKDGKDWSKPQRVLDSWQWLWRVTWHDGTAYGVAYTFGPDKPKTYSAFLARSKDGVRFQKAADFKVPNATEATLAFDGDLLYCLQRRDGSPNSALFGTSKPPYTEWSWKDLGAYFGGPNMIRLPDGAWLACGRRIEGGKPQTVLAALNTREATLKPIVTLPSGGDTSYPGLAWHQDTLWVSYYSSHEGKSSIYLAKLQRAK